MEIEFDDQPKKGKTPGTRMYSPKKSNVKRQERPAHTKAKQKSRAVQDVDATVVDEEGYRIRLSEDQDNPLARVGVMFSAFLLAAMILFMLFGYEQITRAYADVNALTDEIELTQLRITALEVEIECAVTIQQAQEAAEAANMRYPTQGQYVKIGERIPFSGALTPAEPASGTADDGTAGTPDITPEGTPGAEPQPPDDGQEPEQ